MSCQARFGLPQEPKRPEGIARRSSIGRVTNIGREYEQQGATIVIWVHTYKPTPFTLHNQRLCGTNDFLKSNFKNVGYDAQSARREG
jgi:hypothetical protein